MFWVCSQTASSYRTHLLTRFPVVQFIEEPVSHAPALKSFLVAADNLYMDIQFVLADMMCFCSVHACNIYAHVHTCNNALRYDTDTHTFQFGKEGGEAGMSNLLSDCPPTSATGFKPLKFLLPEICALGCCTRAGS